MDNIPNTIKETFGMVMREREIVQPPHIHSDLVLLESGLDSLGFAILITRLEDELGFDPFTLDDSAYYPQTFGDLVNYYVKNSDQGS